MINLVHTLYQKSIPAKFKKDLKNISWVIAWTNLLLRTDRQTDAGNNNTPPAFKAVWWKLKLKHWLTMFELCLVVITTTMQIIIESSLQQFNIYKQQLT